MTDLPRWLGLGASVAALVAIVAPFTADTSPLGAIALALEVEDGGFFLLTLALPSLLAVPIAVWQVRRLLRRAPTRLEVALAYSLATAAMLPIPTTTALTVAAGATLDAPLAPVALLVGWCALIGNVGLLVSNHGRGEPRDVTAAVYLLLGYLPGALHVLILFAYWSFIFSPTWMWDLGAYSMLVACVLYVAEAVRVSRSARLDRGASQPRAAAGSAERADG